MTAVDVQRNVLICVWTEHPYVWPSWKKSKKYVHL